MKKIYLIIFMLLFFSASGYAIEISVGSSYQDLDLSGKVKSNGTEIDIEDHLGIGDDEPMGMNARLQLGGHNLVLDLVSVDFSGAKTLTEQIEFEGQTYAVSTDVESKLEYDLYEAQYHYDLFKFNLAGWGVCVSPLFKVSYYEASVSIKGGGNDESYSETLPLPSVGAVGQINATKYLSLLAQINGIDYSGDSYMEYKAILRIKPIVYLNLDIGYKGTEFDYSDGDELLDLDIKGLFFQTSFVYSF
jgi:hypothetical protein